MSIVWPARPNFLQWRLMAKAEIGKLGLAGQISMAVAQCEHDPLGLW